MMVLFASAARLAQRVFDPYLSSRPLAETVAANLKKVAGRGLLALWLFPSLALADSLAVGKVAYANGDYERAVQEFKKATHANQRDSNGFLWLARSLGRKAESLNRLVAIFVAGEVRRAFERAVEIDPKNLEARADLLEFYLHAPGVLGGGLEKARAQAEAIRRLSAADGHLASARIAEKQEDYARAEQELLAAAAADPKNTGRYVDLGQFYRRRQRWADMEASFRKAGDPKAHFYLAEAYLEHGFKVEQAEELLKSFLAAPPEPPGEEPTRPQGHLLLGRVYVYLGRKDEAAREYRAALAENPGLKDARKELERLK